MNITCGSHMKWVVEQKLIFDEFEKKKEYQI